MEIARMTRDEALDSLVSGGLSPADGKQFIRAATILGLLRLDEPRSALSRAIEIIAHTPDNSTQICVAGAGMVVGEAKSRQIAARLAAAGFKIVEA